MNVMTVIGAGLLAMGVVKLVTLVWDEWGQS